LKKGVVPERSVSQTRLAAPRVTLAALETALDRIPRAAFVIDGGGTILLANAMGRELLGRGRAGTPGALAEAVRGRSSQLRSRLTARQAEVLDLVAAGSTNAVVAEALGIKERTVEFHLSAIFDKAGVDNRATLIARLLAP
jgi:DNA-binding NarL/FixJ family response regulator